MGKIKEILIKQKQKILYLFFGGVTTAINIVAYNFCYYYLKIDNVLSNVVAWVLSVCFAYLSNKIWVFEGAQRKFYNIIKEMGLFFACRFLTGTLDTAIMYVAVNMLGLTAWIFKIISNVIVIILNYIVSKNIIFNKNKEKEK